jgi:regulator of replication initiation timing
VQELNDYKDKINLNNRETDEFKKKIQKLIQENSFLNDETKMAQENLRLSNAQQQKILNELNEYKQKIQENESQNEGIKRKIQNLVQ